MDPIADFLNKLKMASRQGLKSFSFPVSRLIVAVVGALEKKGYIASSRRVKKGREIELAFPTGAHAPRVTAARRMSKLSKRLYRKVHEIRPVRNGAGFAVLSTSRGVLTDTEARAAKEGGEVLFEIW